MAGAPGSEWLLALPLGGGRARHARASRAGELGMLALGVVFFVLVYLQHVVPALPVARVAARRHRGGLGARRPRAAPRGRQSQRLGARRAREHRGGTCGTWIRRAGRMRTSAGTARRIPMRARPTAALAPLRVVAELARTSNLPHARVGFLLHGAVTRRVCRLLARRGTGTILPSSGRSPRRARPRMCWPSCGPGISRTSSCAVDGRRVRDRHGGVPRPLYAAGDRRSKTTASRSSWGAPMPHRRPTRCPAR